MTISSPSNLVNFISRFITLSSRFYYFILIYYTTEQSLYILKYLPILFQLLYYARLFIKTLLIKRTISLKFKILLIKIRQKCIIIPRFLKISSNWNNRGNFVFIHFEYLIVQLV